MYGDVFGTLTGPFDDGGQAGDRNARRESAPSGMDGGDRAARDVEERQTIGGRDGDDEPGHAGDEAIDLTMTDPSTPASATDRFLFLSAQRGLRDAVIQSSARYRATIEPWIAPNATLAGIPRPNSSRITG